MLVFVEYFNIASFLLMRGIRLCGSISGSVLVASAVFTGFATAADWREKIDPLVSVQLDEPLSAQPDAPAANGLADVDNEPVAPAKIEFFAFLGEQADLRGAQAVTGRAARGAWVMEQLVSAAQRSQAPIVAMLRDSGAEYRVYWVANMVWARGDAAVIEALARRSDVARILGNPRITMPEPVPEPISAPTLAPLALAAIEPNLTQVGAPDAWALGARGQGVLLASADTGVQWDHPALKGQYAGWDGSVADHNYRWHDAIHSGGGSCGADSPMPCDDNSHGTHTVGTMLGDDGGANQLGMAPDARWIACRNMDQGTGSPATYSECFQWFIAPTDLNDQFPDPARAPHAINNSWSCPAFEGCGDPLILQTVVENTRAAGIAVIAAAGNAGPSCSSIATPINIYDASYTVAATSSANVIASFSSRGPVTIDGSNRLKPDIAAPGVSIRSSIPPNSYGHKSGTSMAAPHVAGLMALLMSANAALQGQPALLESYVNGYALPLTSNQGCGGDLLDTIPNHAYGHGRIDALASVHAASGINVPALPLSGAAIMAVLLLLSGSAYAIGRRYRR